MKTDRNLKLHFESLKENKIRAFNYAKNQEETLCFNIIEIPDTELSIITISIMYNRRKRAHLDRISFAKLMSILESTFEQVKYDCNIEDDICLTPVHNTQVNNNWYSLLNCHRLFFLPTETVFSVLRELTCDSFLSQLKGVVSETSYYVNTLSHHLKIVRIVY